MAAVRFEVDGALGHIILDDPPFNWIGDSLRHELREAVHAAKERDIRALLIRSTGPNFSCGGAVHDWIGKSPGWVRAFMTEADRLYRGIEALRIPVVTAVRGNTFGGGLELALTGDFLIASETALLWSLEIRAGIVPLGGGVQRLVDRVGRARAMRIVMLGEKTPVSAVAEVADHIVPDGALDGFALAFATRLSQGPTQAYAATKALVKAYAAGGVGAADRLMEDLTAHLFQTEDVRRGMEMLVPLYMGLGAPGYVPAPDGFELPEVTFSGV